MLAWIMSALRVNLQQKLAPISVSFTHGRPVCAGKYYEYFQSPVIFDSPVSRLELPLDMVDLILPSGNEKLATFSDQAMAIYLATLDNEDLVTRVKKIIVEHLPSGDATVENAAAELYLSTRKLQRLLKEKGTTFISLLNETRMRIARQYVQNKNMDLTEIAFLLGFAEMSTFSRSFKRWTGQSPIQYRKAV
jgi:AraC-like DNA-binding protein